MNDLCTGLNQFLLLTTLVYGYGCISTPHRISKPNNKEPRRPLQMFLFYLRAGIRHRRYFYSTIRRSTSLAHHKRRNFGGLERNSCLKRVSGNAGWLYEVISFHRVPVHYSCQSTSVSHRKEPSKRRPSRLAYCVCEFVHMRRDLRYGS